MALPEVVSSADDPAEKAKADFQAGVVRITANEYETALAVAAGRAHSSDRVAALAGVRSAMLADTLPCHPRRQEIGRISAATYDRRFAPTRAIRR
jgi:hypothetical protein